MAAKKTRSKTTKKRPARAKKKTSREATRARAADEAGEARVAQIKRLIDVMVASGAVEVEWEGAGEKLRVRLKDENPAVVSYASAPPPAAPPSHTPSASAPGEPAAAAAEPAPGGVVFHSPMVGTFYASPSPDAEPFVRVGDRIDDDTTLCILEAMKVMNEIKAEISGSIVEVLVQNGQPVEFGQPLFVIDAD